MNGQQIYQNFQNQSNQNDLDCDNMEMLCMEIILYGVLLQHIIFVRTWIIIRQSMQRGQQREEEAPGAHEAKQSRLLEYYNVKSVEELVEIMMDKEKSQVYHEVRFLPTPHIDIQKFSTVKSAIQYKRHLLTTTLQETHQQMKTRIATVTQQISNTWDNKQGRNSNSSGTVSENQVLQISQHSYDQLLTYFRTANNSLLCRQILAEKYMRSQIIHAHKIRKQLWLMLIDMPRKQELSPGLYQSLSAYDNYPDFYGKIILADVVRTVQDSDESERKCGRDKMQKILQCYARRNPFIGYCQGMNFIVSFVMTMGFSEEECFWMLATALQDIIPPGYYTNMSGVAIDIKILQIILSLLRPKISKKLQSLELDISVFVLEWLVCLFTSILPFYLLIIVWDLLLIQGSVVLFKATLILLDYMEPIIEEAKDFAHFFKLYETVKKKIYIEEEVFIRKLMSIYIDEKILVLARQIVEHQLKQFKENSQKETKENEKWRESGCDGKWPVCIQQLKKFKLNDIDVDVWTFRDEAGPRLTVNYLDHRHRKVLSQDEREQEKRLLIGRIPHICGKNQNNSKRTTVDSIELSSIENGQYEKNQQMEQQDFFRRASQNIFAFKNLLKYNGNKK